MDFNGAVAAKKVEALRALLPLKGTLSDAAQAHTFSAEISTLDRQINAIRAADRSGSSASSEPMKLRPGEPPPPADEWLVNLPPPPPPPPPPSATKKEPPPPGRRREASCQSLLE